MKATLEQYIDPENIPSQYGGKLEYKFGDLPNLDPKIQKSLKWFAPEKLNGRNTFPTGPIRLQRYQNGDLAAVAVGSENGKARDKKIATITPDKSVAQTALGAGNQGTALYRTTTGIETHPPEPTQKDMALVEPPAGQSTATPPPDAAAGLGVVGGAGAAGGTYLSYRDSFPVDKVEDDADEDKFEDSHTHHPSTDRQGTSSSRYADQSHTHADGNVAEGTPHVEGSQGDKYSVMEPNTVGQAPKEHPMPQTQEPAQPSYMDQAKSLAGSAAGTAAAVGSSALAAVGLGGTKVEEEVKEESKPAEDPAVDQADANKVEEFLRSQHSSQNPGKEAANAM